MKMSDNVVMDAVSDNIKKVLPIIDLVFFESGNHLVVTAAKWGSDTTHQAHKAGNAIDVKAPDLFGSQVLYKLKGCLGLNYRVVDMLTHYHIEFLPDKKGGVSP